MDDLSLEYYRYRPLKDDQIRLLHIEPSARLNESISCHMRHYSFDDLDDVLVRDIRKKEYGTLSSAWGTISSDESHLTDMIFVDGMPLQVTAHLNQALKRFRQLNLIGLTLWVDAAQSSSGKDGRNLRQVAQHCNMAGRVRFSVGRYFVRPFVSLYPRQQGCESVT